MAKTNKQVIEAWLRDDGERVSSGSLSCTPDGQLFSYDLLIGVWESVDMHGPLRPVLWKYWSSSIKAENASVSVTTSCHVSLVLGTAAQMKVPLELRTPTGRQVQMARAARGPRQGREGLVSRALEGKGRWVPCPEGLPHHLDKRHPKDRRYLHPDIPEDVVVAILWCEPSTSPPFPGFYLPSVWMNGKHANFESLYYRERGAMKAALDEYKANLPSPPARSLPSTWS